MKSTFGINVPSEQVRAESGGPRMQACKQI